MMPAAWAGPRREAQVDDVPGVEQAPCRGGQKRQHQLVARQADRPGLHRLQRRRRLVQQEQRHAAQCAVQRGHQEDRAPVEMQGHPDMADLPHGDAQRPAHHQDAHGGGQLMAGKPVSRHLGQVDGADDEAGTGRDASQREQAEALGHGGNDPAGGQAEQRAADEYAVGQPAPQVAGGQCQHQPGQHEQPDQRADLDIAEAQRRDQRIRYRTERLELETQAGAADEQQGQDPPAGLAGGQGEGLGHAQAWRSGLRSGSCPSRCPCT
jgi:hypothetical protein